jgi:hypothetical protein
MKATEIQALESYFKTDNEHWNAYAFAMLCEVLKQGDFESPEIPLNLFSKSVDILIKDSETPLKAIEDFGGLVDEQKLSSTQKLFVYEKVFKYFKDTGFNNVDTEEIKELLKSKVEYLKNEAKNRKPEYNKPLVGSIRDMLKEQMQKELAQLPETLKDLEPIQRLNVLCKLIPYVLPKVEAVHSESGEPETENKTSISGFQWD